MCQWLSYRGKIIGSLFLEHIFRSLEFFLSQQIFLCLQLFLSKTNFLVPCKFVIRENPLLFIFIWNIPACQHTFSSLFPALEYTLLFYHKGNQFNNTSLRRLIGWRHNFIANSKIRAKICTRLFFSTVF